MTYLFLGEDREAKDKKIAELKKKLFPSPDATSFDYEILYGHKLNPQTLQRSLLALPVIAPQRMIILHECQRMDEHNQSVIVNFLKTNTDYIILILDCDDLNLKEGFVQGLRPYVKVIDFPKPVRQNVFDMGRMITMRKPKDALDILNDLLASGDQPVQIMGGLVWSWGKAKDRIPSKRFSEGLLALQEADTNIKRSRLKPEYALELLVVKLCSLGERQ